jgi:primosomal protein N' (replication factor Y)
LAENVRVGQLVIVPVRGKPVVAVVTDLPEDVDIAVPLKPILATLDYFFAPEFLLFLKQAASYTMIPQGHLLSMAILSSHAALQRIEALSPFPTYTFYPQTLSPHQQKAADAVTASLETFETFVLDGVTGSGKTEVYFAMIHQVISRGHKALVLLPEIALTDAIVQRFKAAFGDTPLIWHSQVTPAKKRKIWKGVQQAGPAVILGARSALFLPIKDLSLVVIDEEHDTSYKQDEQGVYNARDLAILRAKHERCPIVLASATPSLETYAHIKSGRYQHLILPNRHAEARLPDVILLNRKDFPKSLIAPAVCEAINERLQKGEQTLLFLNRRGFSTMQICYECGHHWECPGCHVDLTVHKDRKLMLCHYCGFETPQPTTCPHCNNIHLSELGCGVEKVEEEARNLFPNARVLLVSSDTLKDPIQSQELILKISNGEVDIIVGTQVLAKGHHFPMLTCVAILDADRSLSQMDLRSAEKTFQMLSQVGGRAGRMADQKGQVFVQTRDPDHPLFQSIKAYDRDAFYEAELADRELLEMPPFARLIAITVSSLQEMTLVAACRLLTAHIPNASDFEVLGPTPAPLYRLRSRYRMRFLVRAHRSKNIQAFTKAWLSSCKLGVGVQVHVDVDPLNFM